ncbi:MAG: hypothetical protein ACRC46_08010 [Thermoguttaceae bacterium]
MSVATNPIAMSPPLVSSPVPVDMESPDDFLRLVDREGIGNGLCGSVYAAPSTLSDVKLDYVVHWVDARGLGRGLWGSVEAIDHFIEEERKSWD